ncbi:extracellular solute-binding protein [Paenibacillus sp. HB172176]|uniref:extracellular solute-binding protein n=1 Tax=Paenibacillus sp. HB172176 TaxID=2493690 RepID=UPI00143C2996|nr:extracellular solute-binding protein [Paenibacillus sp. HB172176]
MKKQFLSVLGLVICMLFVLAACSDDNKEPSKSSASSGTAQNETVKKGHITVSVYDRGNVPASEGTIDNNRWAKWINDNGPTDVTFVPIPRNDPAQKWNVLFASGNAPDVVNEFAPNILDPLIDQKQLMPLDDLIENSSVEYKELLKEYPALKKVTTGTDGNIYKVGRVLPSFPLNAMFIRMDWLEKLHLDVPKTTEELYQVAKAFAEQDPDGNGEKDTYGIAISWRSENVINGMFGSPGASYGLVDGLPGRGFEYAKQATEFKKRLFDEGIVDQDFANDKNGAKAKQDFLNGKLGIYPAFVGNWFNFTVTDLQLLTQADPGAIVEPIALPESPAGEYIPELQNPVQATTAINAKTKDPVAAIKYIDFIDRESTGRTLLFGQEGVHYQLDEAGCPQSIDPAKTKTEVSWAVDFSQSYTRMLSGQCASTETQFNTDVPEQKAGLEMYQKANQLYMDSTKKYPTITLGEHMPTLPKDMQTTFNTINSDIADIWTKAVLSGSKYTVDQAYKDVVSNWEKAGGKEIDEFMIDWYKNKQDSAFLMSDYWDTVDQQKLQQ